MHAPQRLARITGACYLAVALLSVFAIIYVQSVVLVPGDGPATAGRIAEHPVLFRWGFLADLGQATLLVFVAMGFYRLFEHVHRTVARALLVFAAIGVALQCLNLVFYFAAYLVATDASYASALGPEGAGALVGLLVEIYAHGFLIAQVFFGLWLLPMGYLAYISGMFPRALGVVLMIACAGYLIDLIAMFLVPAVGEAISGIIVLPAVVGEVWMVFYLLTRGVKTPRAAEPLPAADSPPTPEATLQP